MAIKIGQNSFKDSVTSRETFRVKPQISFEKTLNGEKKTIGSDALKVLLGKVDEQAKRVAVSRTVRDVQLYKKYVQSFMKEAVQTGFGTSRSRSWQQGGAHQTLIRMVDEKLVRLTDHVLDENKDELSLLDRLDEIRGLLIDLYV
ncbi:DUF327 family protein [Sporolactobacillus sp. THM7-4]|nr:DUF327 family protein [Sporolactobacillus sp. THM7-4]